MDKGAAAAALGMSNGTAVFGSADANLARS